MDVIFFKEHNIALLADNARKISVTPDRNRITVCCRALEAVPIGRVSKLTRIDFMILTGAPPQAIVKLTNIVHIGNSTNNLYSAFFRDTS